MTEGKIIDDFLGAAGLIFHMCVGGCEAFDMKMIFYSHSRITHFLIKVFALNITFESVVFWNLEMVYIVYSCIGILSHGD